MEREVPMKLALAPCHHRGMSLRDAWHGLHAATPAGWYVGRPSYHDERQQWVQYAFDPSERPKVGIRSREMDRASRVGGRRRARDGPLPPGAARGQGAEVADVTSMSQRYSQGLLCGPMTWMNSGSVSYDRMPTPPPHESFSGVGIDPRQTTE